MAKNSGQIFQPSTTDNATPSPPPPAYAPGSATQRLANSKGSPQQSSNPVQNAPSVSQQPPQQVLRLNDTSRNQIRVYVHYRFKNKPKSNEKLALSWTWTVSEAVNYAVNKHPELCTTTGEVYVVDWLGEWVEKNSLLASYSYLNLYITDNKELHGWRSLTLLILIILILLAAAGGTLFGIIYATIHGGDKS